MPFQLLPAYSLIRGSDVCEMVLGESLPAEIYFNVYFILNAIYYTKDVESNVDISENDSAVLTDDRRFESRHLSDSLHHPIDRHASGTFLCRHLLG
jgi:hypothetical protein